MSIKVENGYSTVKAKPAINMLKHVPVKPGKKYIRVLYLYIGDLPPEDVGDFVEDNHQRLRQDTKDESLYADTYIIPYRGEKPQSYFEFYEVEE